MTQTTSSGIGARLRAQVRGPVWQEHDDGYDDARRVWNGAVDRRPAVVVRCVDAADVRTALLVARDHGVPLSVRGGGHDWAGRALTDGGVVLDLSALRDVEIDAGAGVAAAQGGALVADVVDPADAVGLGTATAVVRTVGMAGMTLAGGYGGLVGRFGLALDNLLSADVLLADGTQVVAGPTGDPELLWALRGGGGNVGIVTAARYRLHPLGPVLGGMVLYPKEQAVGVLRGYREVLATAPDELTVMAGFVGGPDGGAAVYVAPTWSGDLAAGEAAVAPLLRLGTPVAGGVGPMPYPELIRMFEAGAQPGQHYALGTRWLPTLTDDAIEALAEGAASWLSPSSLLALHHFHGAATRVAPDATAFALRQEHVLAEVIAAWRPDPAGSGPAPHHAWVEGVAEALEPGALPGGYPNILGPADADRVRLGFGANADRLLAAKRRYDPDGVLTAIAAMSP
ncbi:FAD-binding oxidoreductase [Cellulomonas xylanilytica]|uniref:6-hydroxy-D-nicotine oxidase n=1 Tax=Cellulomonas xylanilytica TaxID=233583 RepID=A0A510V552_9CELL|nr:FAD-binding oxidoreductase [Cellulomonas xylanilytica]GEK20440.1 6-hydroxy-D-nicotine oxidase [Cellulomonas xylanilytica]